MRSATWPITGRTAESLKVLAQASDALKRVAGADHFYVLAAMEHFASAYQAAGDFPKAIPIMEEIVRLRTVQAGASASAVTAVSCAIWQPRTTKWAVIPRQFHSSRRCLKTTRRRKAPTTPTPSPTCGILAHAYRVAKHSPRQFHSVKKCCELTKSRFGPATHRDTRQHGQPGSRILRTRDSDDKAVLLLEPALELEEVRSCGRRPS